MDCGRKQKWWEPCMENQNSSHPFWELVLTISFTLGCVFIKSSPIIQVFFYPSSFISVLCCSSCFNIFPLFFLSTCLLTQSVSNSLKSCCFPLFSSDNLLLSDCNPSSTSNDSLIRAFFFLVLICSSFLVIVM